MSYFDLSILGSMSLLANFFASISGGGAGLIQFPILLFFGYPFAMALATHKFATVFLGIGAMSRIFKEKILEWPFVLFLFTVGVSGVILGANTILRVPEEWAIRTLGILTIGLGVYSFFKKELGLKSVHHDRKWWGKILGGIGIFAIGFFNGCLSSGSGLFLTLFMVRYYGFEYKKALSYTMALCGIIWNGAGAITLGLLSEIAWEIVPVLVLASLLGGYLGAHWALKKGNSFIKRVFEVGTVLVGVKLLVS